MVGQSKVETEDRLRTEDQDSDQPENKGICKAKEAS
jgi:hypothetical protein